MRSSLVFPSTRINTSNFHLVYPFQLGEVSLNHKPSCTLLVHLQQSTEELVSRVGKARGRWTESLCPKIHRCDATGALLSSQHHLWCARWGKGRIRKYGWGELCFDFADVNRNSQQQARSLATRGLWGSLQASSPHLHSLPYSYASSDPHLLLLISLSPPAAY